MDLIDPTVRGVLRSLVVGESPWPLVMHGPAGTGKTCAALCLIDWSGGAYHTCPGLCNLLIQSQQGRLEWNECGRGGTVWPEKLWSNLASQPIVVLDEIGLREKVSDAHYEVVKELLERRHCKPLVVISNVDLSVVNQVYDERIFSRLSAGTVVHLEGKDRRLM